MDTRLLHEHHVHPQGYGGEDDPKNLVWLCGSCHDLVHRLAHMIKSKKRGQAVDLAFQYQTSQNLSPAAKKRLLDLSQVVAVAMETYVPEAGDDLDILEQDRVLVQLALPRSIHTSAKSLAQGCTNPKSGRPMGLYRYLELVVINHVHRLSNAPGLASTEPSSMILEMPDTQPQVNDFTKIP